MKQIFKLHNILAALALAFLATACQEITEIDYAMPTLTTGDASSIGFDEAVIRGSATNANGNFYFYIIQHGDSIGGLSTQQISCDTIDGPRFRVRLRNLTPNTSYDYVLCATDGKYKETRGQLRTFTTRAYASIASITYTDWDGTTKQAGYEQSPMNATVFVRNSSYGVQLTYDGSKWQFSRDFDPRAIDSVSVVTPYSNFRNTYNYSQRFTTLSSNPDVMYGWTSVSGNGENISINLSKLMANVVFNFRLADDYPESSVNVSSLDLKGSNIAGEVNINVASKNIALSSGNDNFKYYRNSFSLNKNNYTSISFLTLPTMAGTYTGNTYVSYDQTIMLYFYGLSSEALVTDLDLGDGWQSGHTYEYTMTLHREYVTIDSVRVIPWQKEPGQEIIIKDND